jgi:hypothetical protein
MAHTPGILQSFGFLDFHAGDFQFHEAVWFVGFDKAIAEVLAKQENKKVRKKY